MSVTVPDWVKNYGELKVINITYVPLELNDLMGRTANWDHSANAKYWSVFSRQEIVANYSWNLLHEVIAAGLFKEDYWPLKIKSNALAIRTRKSKASNATPLPLP